MTRRILLLLPGALLLSARELSDDEIYDEVRRRLTADREVKILDLDVAVSQGVVTLKGLVETERLRSRAERIVKKIKAVRGVNNELRIRQ
ncbi:MAG: BON domain-containing protein [Bryobacterales bacterium]|jgi:osmotically-inducible protein OsmY|nr:BON domain-containing protein [Bryobacterales bacterium]